jgi:hypothetical protein
MSRRLQTEPPVENTQIYKDRKEGEGATWETNREDRGEEGSVEMGKGVAGQSRYMIVSGGKGQGY